MSETPQPPEADKSRSLMLAGTFLAIIAVAGIVLVVVNLMRGSTSPAEPRTEPRQVTGQGSTDATAAPPECVLVDGDETVPDSRLDAYPLPWQNVRIGVSPEHGPCQQSHDSLPTGYAHSPTGALLASINFTVLVSTTNMAVEAGEYFIDEAENRDELIDELRDGVDESGTVKLDGFKVMVGNEDLVHVQLAVSINGAAKLNISMFMHYAEGDWRVAPDPSGELWQIEPIPAGTDLRLEGWQVWGF